MHNIKPEINRKNKNKITQINLYNIEIELSIEYDQIQHIGISKSKSIIYTNSLNKLKFNINIFFLLFIFF